MSNKDENLDGVKDVEQLDSTRQKLREMLVDYKQETNTRWGK